MFSLFALFGTGFIKEITRSFSDLLLEIISPFIFSLFVTIAKSHKSKILDEILVAK